MKIIAIYGSPRRSGNTALLLQKAVQGARDEGADVKEIVLRDMEISPCLEIYGCRETGRCVINDDFQMIYDQLATCDGVMLASPVFFYAVSAQVKTLMDRCQSFWVKKYWIDGTPHGSEIYKRKGLLISVGASKGKNLFDGILLNVRYFYDALDIDLTEMLLYRGVDIEGDILKQPSCLQEAYKAGKSLCSNISRNAEDDR